MKEEKNSESQRYISQWMALSQWQRTEVTDQDDYWNRWECEIYFSKVSERAADLLWNSPILEYKL